jgi:hypothetical protein
MVEFYTTVRVTGRRPGARPTPDAAEPSGDFAVCRRIALDNIAIAWLRTMTLSCPSKDHVPDSWATGLNDPQILLLELATARWSNTQTYIDCWRVPRRQWVRVRQQSVINHEGAQSSADDFSTVAVANPPQARRVGVSSPRVR